MINNIESWVSRALLKVSLHKSLWQKSQDVLGEFLVLRFLLFDVLVEAVIYAHSLRFISKSCEVFLHQT